MSDAPFPAASIDANRARGAIEASFRRVGARTEIVGPFETGGYRLRVPRSHDGHCEAVIVNTGGGMAGGDRAAFRFAARGGATATVTTTAAEKLYRADGGTTAIEVALTLAEGATLAWLPQETILFDGRASSSDALGRHGARRGPAACRDAGVRPSRHGRATGVGGVARPLARAARRPARARRGPAARRRHRGLARPARRSVRERGPPRRSC